MFVPTMIFTLVFVFLVAQLEIQIEGKNGWATNLPTWKFNSRIIRFFIGNKLLTGYHFYLFLLVVFIYHSIFLFIPWTISLELATIALVLIFFILEDFLWFLLNPAFGLHKFTKAHVSWHKEWFWLFPTHYYIYSFIVILLLYFSKTL